MRGTLRDDDERFLKTIEDRLGWALPADLQAKALQRRAHGESAASIADALETDDLAGRALNDRDAPLRAPPTRPADDDPAHFPSAAPRRR
ncbi:hypothetical protein [Solimonas soli]|uniref:hypothetical protein n=1 Tax=Solimonas soli TaxID=413479 RepID=UPI000482AF0B|nr:hypothetical protein [Solimonas soli]